MVCRIGGRTSASRSANGTGPPERHIVPVPAASAPLAAGQRTRSPIRHNWLFASNVAKTRPARFRCLGVRSAAGARWSVRTVEVMRPNSAGSGDQADDRQFAVGLLLVLREAGYGGGDLLPRLVAFRSVELFGGDDYLAAGHLDLDLVGAARL
jgi:hypothetical protein